MNNLQYAALEFAVKAHRLQVRKYTGDPYIVHPIEVRSILTQHGVNNDILLCAALLHDVVEDTARSYLDILATFGERVANLVLELTDDKISGNREERKARECRRLAEISQEAQIVKCADLISNTRDICAQDPKFAQVYLKEKKAILNVFRIKGHPIYKSAVAALEDGEAKLNS